MIEILKSIQEQIGTVPEIKHVDEDWGQLDDYGENIPVKWPCALFDVTSVDYSDIGYDKKAKPKNRQLGLVNVTIKFANLKLTNSSLRAPVVQKDKAWQLHKIQQDAHEVIQGFEPAINCSPLIRSKFRRVKRDDGVQQYEVTYTMEVTNI